LKQRPSPGPSDGGEPETLPSVRPVPRKRGRPNA
jgi:hypothetical protein